MLLGVFRFVPVVGIERDGGPWGNRLGFARAGLLDLACDFRGFAFRRRRLSVIGLGRGQALPLRFRAVFPAGHAFAFFAFVFLLEKNLELAQRLVFNLPHAFAGQSDFLADFFQRERFGVFRCVFGMQPVPQFNDVPFAIGQREFQCGAQRLTVVVAGKAMPSPCAMAGVARSASRISPQ